MVTAYLLFVAITFKSAQSIDVTCFERLCNGPKFRQSDCCEGFICVALYKPGAEDVLECVDEEEHFRVKSIAEILQEVDREFGESSDPLASLLLEVDRELGESDDVQNHTLLLEDMSLDSYIAKIREVEDVFEMDTFNNPVIIENLPKNITI